MFFVTVDDITKYACGRKNKAQIREAKAKDWASPMGLEVDRGPETEESHRSKEDCNDDEWKPELGLVYAFVLFRKEDTNPIVQRA